MKQPTLTATLLALSLTALPSARAVEFNTEALKTMQKEGHEIVEQEKGLRAFQLASGLCLHAAKTGKPGAKLQVAACKEKSDNQKWRFDDEGRLANQGGTCVGIAGNAKKPGAKAELQKCSGAAHQRWQVDNRQRLVNGLNLCLEAANNGKKAGAGLKSVACGDSPGQTWK
jgi:hypothetical protein